MHLKVDDTRTVDALHSIISLAKKKKVDVLTIGGDIFHSPNDANKLRPILRGHFQNLPFKVIAIPGNHDGNIFKKGFDFGFEVSTDFPYSEIVVGNTSIIALPYTDEMIEDLISELKTAGQDSKHRVLLLHCTLDIGYSESNYGENCTRRYFPVSRGILAELGFDYILAGHFHSNYQTIPLKNDCEFIYPGSPVSINKGETGKRSVAIVDVEKRKTKQVHLPTFHYDSLIVEVVPKNEKVALEEISKWCNSRESDNCEMEITVRGMINRDETRFRKQIERVASNAILHYEVSDVREVHQHTLFVSFKKTLPKIVTDPDIDDVTQTVIEIMSSLIIREELDN